MAISLDIAVIAALMMAMCVLSLACPETQSECHCQARSQCQCEFHWQLVSWRQLLLQLTCLWLSSLGVTPHQRLPFGSDCCLARLDLRDQQRVFAEHRISEINFVAAEHMISEIDCVARSRISEINCCGLDLRDQQTILQT